MRTAIMNKKMSRVSFFLFLSILSFLVHQKSALGAVSFKAQNTIIQTGSRIEDIATSEDGMIYAVDSSNKQILIYDGNNFLESTIAVERPSAVAINNQVIYVGSNKDLSVKMLDLFSGEVIGQMGNGEQEFKLPRNISINPSNQNIYVVDQLDHSIKIYTPDGKFINQIDDSPNMPQDLAIFGDEIFVLDQPLVTDKYGYQVRGARVNVYDMDGVEVRNFGTFGAEAGQIFKPKAIASDENGILYITDAFHGAVLCFDLDGNYIQTIQDSANPMIAPMGVAIDPFGRLLVSSPATSKVHLYQLGAEISGTPVNYTLYFPKVEDSDSQTFTNIISVQNLAETEHEITFKAYNANDGSLAAIHKKTVPAGGVVRLRPAGGGTEWQTSGDSITGLPRFFGSIVIDSSEPILATNLFLAPSGATSIFGSVVPEQSMLFPMVLDNQEGWETWLTVQNIYDTPQGLTVSVYDTAGNIAGTDTVTLQGNAVYHIRPSSVLDPTWINTKNHGQRQIEGSLVVTCNNSPLAGLLSYQHGSPVDRMSVYSSIKPTSEIFMPIIKDTSSAMPDAEGPFNDLYLTSSTIQSVSYEMFHYDGTPVASGSGTLTFKQRNETLIVSPWELANMAAGQSIETFEGVMKITAPSPIYGLNMVEHIGTASVKEAVSLAFEFPAKPEKELYFPEVYDGASGWTSTISIQNTAGFDHPINVVFIQEDGKTFTEKYTVPANGAYILSPGKTGAGSLADNVGKFQGAIHITAPEPVAAALQYAHSPDESFPGQFDALEIYNGLAAPIKK